jgi:hypothetical protein
VAAQPRSVTRVQGVCGGIRASHAATETRTTANCTPSWEIESSSKWHIGSGNNRNRKGVRREDEEHRKKTGKYRLALFSTMCDGRHDLPFRHANGVFGV